LSKSPRKFTNFILKLLFYIV